MSSEEKQCFAKHYVLFGLLAMAEYSKCDDDITAEDSLAVMDVLNGLIATVSVELAMSGMAVSNVSS